MKINRQGKAIESNMYVAPVRQPKYMYTMTCTECDCNFSYTKSDSKVGYNAPNYAGPIGRYINCPNCGRDYTFGTGKKSLNTI